MILIMIAASADSWWCWLLATSPGSPVSPRVSVKCPGADTLTTPRPAQPRLEPRNINKIRECRVTMMCTQPPILAPCLQSSSRSNDDPDLCSTLVKLEHSMLPKIVHPLRGGADAHSDARAGKILISLRGQRWAVRRRGEWWEMETARPCPHCGHTPHWSRGSPTCQGDSQGLSGSQHGDQLANYCDVWLVTVTSNPRYIENWKSFCQKVKLNIFQR